MKERKEEGDVFESMREMVPRSSPPTPPPLPKFRVFSRPREEESVTKREIAKFWRQKQIEEEDHLLAAIKSAARLRARNLTEQEYRSFEFSLRTHDTDEDDPKEERVKRVVGTNDCCKKDTKDKEVRVGIKDWWTKSKYAYLNQPAVDSMDPPKKRTSTYVPNYLSYKPKALYPTAIGVF
ncbi:uncharacterized protein LOC133291793 [Gastrolobium bilobum]|uniref:uncharacterized protein LOC133291793 n=1 Tax=Gastrolobium bilobum TaxID=150636 RepID=UPI002AB04DA3|nr:uncharacterized protein LOC133291793 [Gastrolobium bilobum]